jgi:SAM-dependent methyltransferase
MLKNVTSGLRRVAPSFYSRARNGVSLAQWCTLRALGIQSDEDAVYDEAFWACHDGGDWDAVAALIVDRFSPRAVSDVGCGDGKLLAALKRVAPGVRATGYDSSKAALAAARKRGVDAAWFELAFRGRGTAESLAMHVRRCDLSISLETAEHLPPWSARPFVHVLTQAPIVLFSAAQPMQGGTMHMNEQPLRYWADRFAEVGFALHPSNTAFRHAVAELDLPWWYGRNIQVFGRRA